MSPNQTIPVQLLAGSASIQNQDSTVTSPVITKLGEAADLVRLSLEPSKSSAPPICPVAF